MEHVVFFPAGNTSQSRRVPSLPDALRLVEQLRNVDGVEDISVHALSEVPLSFRTWVHVELTPGAPSDAPAAPFVEPGYDGQPTPQPHPVAVSGLSAGPVPEVDDSAGAGQPEIWAHAQPAAPLAVVNGWGTAPSSGQPQPADPLVAVAPVDGPPAWSPREAPATDSEAEAGVDTPNDAQGEQAGPHVAPDGHPGVVTEQATAEAAAPAEAAGDGFPLDGFPLDGHLLDGHSLDVHPLDVHPFDQPPLDVHPLDVHPLEPMPLEPIDAEGLAQVPVGAMPPVPVFARVQDLPHESGDRHPHRNGARGLGFFSR